MVEEKKQELYAVTVLDNGFSKLSALYKFVIYCNCNVLRSLDILVDYELSNGEFVCNFLFNACNCDSHDNGYRNIV